jgi:ABC-type sugar transport system ATPase subunit
VALALGLASQPRLIVFDEPVIGVDLLGRDEILVLLRSLVDDGIAVLMSVGETPALAGADRALAIADGELRGAVAPKLAPVLPLRRVSGVSVRA